MEAKIIKLSELKKTPEEREAERLVSQLDAVNAIEVALGPSDSPRKVTSLFRRAAKTLGKQIRIRRRDDKVYVVLR